jgi:GNAT superfamily N-acetyltransferase
MDIVIENLQPAQISEVAALWHQGWIDGHAAVVPKELTALRTLESFEIRTRDLLGTCRVAISGDQVLGFTMVNDDELYQLYAGAAARGRGVAQALIQDFEDRMLNAGHRKIWLACAIGNERAARFYTKMGWTNVREEAVELETLADPFTLTVWRFEKTLA